MFVSKILKITKVEKTYFLNEVDVLNKNGYLEEVVTQMDFAKKSVLK